MKLAGPGIYATRHGGRPLARGRQHSIYAIERQPDGPLLSPRVAGKNLRLNTVKPAAGSAIKMFGYPQLLRWPSIRRVGLQIDLPETLVTSPAGPPSLRGASRFGRLEDWMRWFVRWGMETMVREKCSARNFHTNLCTLYLNTKLTYQ